MYIFIAEIFNGTLNHNSLTKMIKRIVLSIFLVGSGFLITTSCSNEKSEKPPSPEVVDKKIGVQIYSVRNELKEDFNGTLEKLSEIGFDYIESYGLSTDGTLYGMPANEYKDAVESYGMKLISSHSTYFTPEEAPVVIEAAKQAGLKYVIIPYLSDELRNDYDAIATNLNEVGALFKEAGIGFGYHNHEFEFFEQEDGRIPLEILIEGTNPENVDFQLDLYWVTKAEFDPMTVINKYPGRFTAFHVKDSDIDLDQTTVGTGIVDFKTILSNKEIAGMEYYFVEDERTDDPFSNLRAAYEYLQALELE